LSMRTRADQVSVMSKSLAERSEDWEEALRRDSGFGTCNSWLDGLASSWPPSGSQCSAELSGRIRGPSLMDVDFSQVKRALRCAQTALDAGMAKAERPERDGVSGTYLICCPNDLDSPFVPPHSTPAIPPSSPKNVLGVFKPADEEAGSLANPHGIFTELGCSLTRGSSLFHAGEGAYKEVAAYLLDHRHFVKVPQTTMAKCHLDGPGSPKTPRHSKVGAFQTFVEVRRRNRHL